MGMSEDPQIFDEIDVVYALVYSDDSVIYGLAAVCDGSVIPVDLGRDALEYEDLLNTPFLIGGISRNMHIGTEEGNVYRTGAYVFAGIVYPRGLKIKGRGLGKLAKHLIDLGGVKVNGSNETDDFIVEIYRHGSYQLNNDPFILEDIMRWMRKNESKISALELKGEFGEFMKYMVLCDMKDGRPTHADLKGVKNKVIKLAYPLRMQDLEILMDDEKPFWNAVYVAAQEGIVIETYYARIYYPPYSF